MSQCLCPISEFFDFCHVWNCPLNACFLFLAYNSVISCIFFLSSSPRALHSIPILSAHSQAGEISRVESILKSGMTPEVDAKIKDALARRARALEAAQVI